MDPRVSSGSSTGHGAPSGNPRTQGDRRRRNLAFAALGWLVTGLALGFVGWQLVQGDTWQLAGDRLERLAPAVLLGAVAYGLASFLLAEAWRQLLGPGASDAPPLTCHAVYGRTQIVKYLPGNLFHFAGRQILGRRLGHEQATLALASMAEILLLLLVAAILAAPLAPRWLSPHPAIAWTVVALATAAAGTLTIRLVHGTPRPAWWRAWTARITLQQLGRAALLHTAFFVVGGILLWLLGRAAGGPGPGGLGLATSISALALAWMAGFVTPGSSAGFGVREAVLIVMLQGSLDREAGVLIALAMRLVTLLGDLLFFAASLALPLPDAPTAGSATVHPSVVK